MPYSKFNKDLEFNEDQWVVSLINTQGNPLGGHAKIVVEGVIQKAPGFFENDLFIGEYHIMEANRLIEETWIPQIFRNTKCNFTVLFTERNHYTERQEEQYSKVHARSVGALKPADVMRMIKDIKLEQQKINRGEKEAQFQYAGKWCIYSFEYGHNCTTWAEEKLNIIGIGQYLITDSSKASPALHIDSNNGFCKIL